jgi:hypothetical protein
MALDSFLPELDFLFFLRLDDGEGINNGQMSKSKMPLYKGQNASTD